MSTGLMCFDCSGVTTENSAICLLFLIRYGNSVVLVTPIATCLSIILDIEWEISRFAVSVSFSSDVTFPVVLHFDGWSTKAVIVFVVGGSVRASTVITGWGFVVVSLEYVLACIVKCGNCMRPYVVLMTTLLFLIKCHAIVGPVIFSIKTKSSVNILCPLSNLNVAVANGFPNWPLVICI